MGADEYVSVWMCMWRPKDNPGQFPAACLPFIFLIWDQPGSHQPDQAG